MNVWREAHLGDNKLNVLLLIHSQLLDGLDLPLGTAGAEWRAVRSLQTKGAARVKIRL